MFVFVDAGDIQNSVVVTTDEEAIALAEDAR